MDQVKKSLGKLLLFPEMIYPPYKLPLINFMEKITCSGCGRGKLGHLNGELQSPSQTDPTYKNWLAENSIVLALLINSMEPNISRRYLWFKTTKEVWDAAKKMYSDLGNASQIFELRSKLMEMKQGSNSVTRYFSDIQDLWQELDLFLETSIICVECTAKVQANVEKERVFDFLAGLNSNLDDVRGRVVARDPFPSPEDAFAEGVRKCVAKLCYPMIITFLQ